MLSDSSKHFLSISPASLSMFILFRRKDNTALLFSFPSRISASKAAEINERS